MDLRYVLLVVGAAVLAEVNGSLVNQTSGQITVTTKTKNGRNVTTVTVPDRELYTLNCLQPDDPQKIFVIEVEETLFIAPKDAGEDCENQYTDPSQLCSSLKKSSCIVLTHDPSTDPGCKSRPMRIKFSCVEPPKTTSGPVFDHMGNPFHKFFPDNLFSTALNLSKIFRSNGQSRQ